MKKITQKIHCRESSKRKVTKSSTVADRATPTVVETLKCSLWRHSKSLKLVPFESLGTVSYSHPIATMAVTSAVSTQYTNVTDTARQQEPRYADSLGCIARQKLRTVVNGVGCLQYLSSRCKSELHPIKHNTN